ncbi:MAG: hypothetical protein V4722_11100 [Bacteroidota bacterium]
MKKRFLTIWVLFTIVHSAQSQMGTTTIGTSIIGKDSLGTPGIGFAATPACTVPGPCGASCTVYRFTGTGNWNIPGNWEANSMPPTTITGCSQILINPAGNTECLLNIPVQIISPSVSITVMPGKKFRIPGKLLIQ